MISKDDFWSSVLAAGGIGELSTGDAVFDRRARCVWRVLEGGLIAATDVAQVECWEDVLELEPGAGLPLVERKAAVLRVLCEELPFTVALLPGRLRQLLGEGNFMVTQTDDGVRVALGLDVPYEQVDEVKALLGCVLPRSVVAELEWAGGLPVSYRPLAYLKGDGGQYINTGICPDAAIGCSIETEASQHIQFTQLAGALSSSSGYGFVPLACYSNKTIGFADKNGNRYPQQDGADVSSGAAALSNGYKAAGRVRVALNYMGTGKWVYEDEENSVVRDAEVAYSALKIYLFARNYQDCQPGNYYFYGWDAPIYGARFSEGESLIGSFIPALDCDTGTPGMFDTVNKVFKSVANGCVGDFTYPGKEDEAATYSLRDRMYAKLTEHGMRRLYRVPEGYSSKAEYAAEHGFKVLIETPQPEVGYWSPVWHDREDCIELEWVEADSPAGGLEP